MNHNWLATLSMYYGALVIITGILLYFSPKIRRKELLSYIRLIHLVGGILTGILALLTYLSAPQ